MDARKVSTFRERFTELVESSAKSRTTIAHEFHVAKQTISAWVTGQTSPRLPVVFSLADYFDVNPNWLLGFDVPMHVNTDECQQYLRYYDETLKANDEVGLLSEEETSLIQSYRSLPDQGRQYIRQQLRAAHLMFNESTDE